MLSGGQIQREDSALLPTLQPNQLANNAWASCCSRGHRPMSLPESFRACCLPRIKVQGSPKIIKDPPQHGPTLLSNCPTLHIWRTALCSGLASSSQPRGKTQGSFLSPYMHSSWLSFTWNADSNLDDAFPPSKGGGGGGTITKMVTMVYWRWDSNLFGLHREPGTVLSVSPLGRWGNWGSEKSASFPWAHTTDMWRSRDSTSGLRGVRAWAAENYATLSESIPPSLAPQLLISLSLWRMVLTVPPSAAEQSLSREVSAVECFCSGPKRDRAHSPHGAVGCRPERCHNLLL